MTHSPQAIEEFLRQHRNPYDLLLQNAAPSLLDLGAGDLSFLDELAVQYLPRLQARNASLILHGVDRLKPGSMFGGPLHADPGRLGRWQQAKGLEFQFWGGMDMLAPLPELLPRYTVVTCHAPATPTFALEPTRLSKPVIDCYLRQTKGGFKLVREGNEDALEVLHRGRALLFPPWKFEIRGPLALLEVMAQRGELCVLAAVDSEVFWEVLSQLVDNPAMRPADTVFAPAVLAKTFGPIHSQLMALPEGESVQLANIMALRSALPRVLGPAGTYRFRSVEIRRGAVFPEMPASSTARRFKNMVEETPPWCLILVPER
ncbi:MAG: hypothetical protein ACKO9T_07390 [Nitrospira sp.]